MPQFAIRGIYQNGEIIPIEDIPAQESKNVIIIFLDDDQSRCEQEDWKLAEKQASEDYRSGNIKSAPGIDEMFDMSTRITLQEFQDHIYLRNIGGHNILP